MDPHPSESRPWHRCLSHFRLTDLVIGTAIGILWWFVWNDMVWRKATFFKQHPYQMAAIFLAAWIVHLLLLRKFRWLVIGVVIATVLVPIVIYIIISQFRL